MTESLRSVVFEAIGYLEVVGKGDAGHDHPHALDLAARLRATIDQPTTEPPRPVLVLPSYPDALDDLAGDETTPPSEAVR